MVIVGELVTINSKDQLSEYLRRIHDGWSCFIMTNDDLMMVKKESRWLVMVNND